MAIKNFAKTSVLLPIVILGIVACGKATQELPETTALSPVTPAATSTAAIQASPTNTATILASPSSMATIPAFLMSSSTLEHSMPFTATIEPVKENAVVSNTATFAVDASKMIDLAKQDLKARLNLDSANGIKLKQLEAREWPDTSLGCPQPGLMYAQVITPGYLIILAFGSEDFEYHTNRSDRVILCQ